MLWLSFQIYKHLPVITGKMGDKVYKLVTVTEKDTKDVIAFLRKFFFHDEPLNICVGLLDEPGSTCQELEDYCANSIKEGLSLMAVTPANEIAGVCINGAKRRENEEISAMTDEVNACKNLKFKKILNLLTTVNIQSDIFGKFPNITSLVEVRVLSVDDAYRGKGIAKACINKTKEMAKEQGYDLIKLDCTSHFSALAVASLGGYNCVYKLNYSDYLDEDGKPIFVPEPPHSCVKTYVCGL
ncbi:arylalkylamine N-acetyltransferase 1-like isoform X2 [Rhodnius prolixus]|uniref:arylalkylamine N-acetyltransferase 1-like isoform X2 n=1 Tax=Rhodnius prolixus TaxID=13249 RepID=UPI003D1879B1